MIETFDYSTGALGNKTGTGSGTTGNWQLNPDSTGAATATIVSKTWLSTGITNYTGTPNATALQMSAFSQNAAIQLSSVIDFDTASTTYFSFLYTRNDTSGGGILALQDSNGAGASVQKARLLQGSGGGSINATMGASGGTGNLFPGVTNDVLVIGRLTTATGTNNDTIEIFARADGGTIDATSFGGNSGILTGSEVVTGTADFLYFWNGAANNPQFGEVRMGDNYASVIPEPSTFALLGIAVGYLVYLRRRK